jgi:Uma2 family endonuclease
MVYKEYWIVDTEQSTVETYRSPKFNRAKILTMDEEIKTALLPDFCCPVRDVFEF